MPTQQNQELIYFIQKSKSNGQTDEQIKYSLQQAGWQDNYIEEGFKELENRGGLSPKLIIALVIIFILLAGGAFASYYYIKNQNQKEALNETPKEEAINNNFKAPEEITKTPEENTEEPLEDEVAKPQGPKDRFLEFKAAIENITTFEEVINLQKYMSETTSSKSLGYKQMDLSEEQKNQLIAESKTMPPLIQDIIDISEDINGATGHLIIKIKSNETCGLPIFLENNQWKFGIMDCKKIRLLNQANRHRKKSPKISLQVAAL
jgi:hypothetical protein